MSNKEILNQLTAKNADLINEKDKLSNDFKEMQEKYEVEKEKYQKLVNEIKEKKDLENNSTKKDDKNFRRKLK